MASNGLGADWLYDLNFMVSREDGQILCGEPKHCEPNRDDGASHGDLRLLGNVVHAGGRFQAGDAYIQPVSNEAKHNQD